MMLIKGDSKLLIHLKWSYQPQHETTWRNILVWCNMKIHDNKNSYHMTNMSKYCVFHTNFQSLLGGAAREGSRSLRCQAAPVRCMTCPATCLAIVCNNCCTSIRLSDDSDDIRFRFQIRWIQWCFVGSSSFEAENQRLGRACGKGWNTSEVTWHHEERGERAETQQRVNLYYFWQYLPSSPQIPVILVSLDTVFVFQTFLSCCASLLPLKGATHINALPISLSIAR